MTGHASRAAVIIGGNERSEKALVRILRVDNYDLAFAADRAAALEAVTNRTVDLVIVLDPLPGDDAVELCRALRALDSTNRTAIALVSEVTTIDFRVAAVKAGVDEFVARPLLAGPVRALFRTAVEFKQQPGAELRRRRTSPRRDTM